MIGIRQIKVKIQNDNEEQIKSSVSKKLNINASQILSMKIIKKSIDARDKENIYYVYEVQVILKNGEEIVKKSKSNDIYIPKLENYNFKITGSKIMRERPVIVGSGPAGLFCAYMLSINGYKPIIIERGEKVEDRIITIEEFWKTGKLNEESNVQFGEGGAGTFSDGKLNTLVKDKNNRMKKVYEIFVECGAPKEILYENKPHIGSDLLRKVIINMRNKIISNGGEFRYNTCLTDIIIKDNKLDKIQINNNDLLSCDNLILAIGHSARDTFKMLYKNNIKMASKPFAVGLRIQHLQEDINKAQYGKKYYRNLQSADYKLTYTSKNKRGVYTFCMCPGGYVINSSSKKNHLVINGMSNYKRNSLNANSAIVAQVTPKDYGNDIFDGMNFQELLEEKAYKIANGKIPVQLFSDFQNNTISQSFKTITPEFKGEYIFANLNNIFPKNLSNDIIDAINYFGDKIEGFNNDDAILSAVETRTSSPIRIIRDENNMSNIQGIYPIGEGSGYSGGITTSAMDGLKMAEIIASIYINF